MDSQSYDRSELIDLMLDYLPENERNNASSVVLSNQYLALYNELGAYALKFGQYSTNYKYKIIKLGGGLGTPDGNYGGDFSLELSGFSDVVITTDASAGGGAGGIDGSDNVQAGLRVGWGPFEGSVTADPETSDTTTTGSFDIKAFSAEMEFYGSDGDYAGVLSSIGTNNPIFNGKIGVGERISNLAFVATKSQSFIPAEEFRIQAAYNNLNNEFPNIEIAYTDFYSRVVSNYEFGGLDASGAEGLYFATGIVLQEILEPSSLETYQNLSTQNSINSYIYSKGQDLGNNFTSNGDITLSNFVEGEDVYEDVSLVNALKKSVDLYAINGQVSSVKDYSFETIEEGTSESNSFSFNPGKAKFDLYDSRISIFETYGTESQPVIGAKFIDAVLYDTRQVVRELNGELMRVESATSAGQTRHGAFKN